MYRSRKCSIEFLVKKFGFYLSQTTHTGHVDIQLWRTSQGHVGRFKVIVVLTVNVHNPFSKRLSSHADVVVLFSRAGMSQVFRFSRYNRSRKLDVELKRFVCLEQLLCLTHSRHGRPATYVHTHLRPASELAQYIQPTVSVSGTTVCSTAASMYSTIFSADK